jgi:hypothetical protein
MAIGPRRTSSRKNLIAPLLGILAGAGYALLARWIFDGRRVPWLEPTFAALSIAFLFLVPVGLGAVTVYFGSQHARRSWLFWAAMPWVSCLLLTGALAVLAWEGLICIVMAAPIFLGMGTLGGIAAGVLLDRRRGRAAPPVVTGLAILPLAVFPLEQRLPPPDQERTVITSVVIDAGPEAVWRQIVRVPEIGARELPDSFYHRIGIPRPREATLDRDGVGGLREATFRGGLRFHETITEWEPERTLGFTIRVAPESVSAAILDPHVAVGSAHFDVLYGRFRIEPLSEGRVRLDLLSRHRISTLFNGYAGLWTDAVMRDVQAGISDVVKRRSEEDVR